MVDVIGAVVDHVVVHVVGAGVDHVVVHVVGVGVIEYGAGVPVSVQGFLRQK